MKKNIFTQMHIEILEYTENALDKATAVCYDKTENNIRVKKVVLDLGHRAILRHGFASVKISGISRNIGRQLLRKSHADYLEMSQRYVNMDNAKFIIPPAIKRKGSEAINTFKKACEHSLAIYKELKEKYGVLKEDARYVLPGAIETKIIMSGNLQMWWDFFNLRIDQRAQEECRNVAKEILLQFGKQSTLFKCHPKYITATMN